jgi:hypothetical protein
MKEAIVEIPISLDYTKHRIESAGKTLDADHLVHLIKGNEFCRHIFMYRPKFINEKPVAFDPSRDIIVGDLIEYIEEDGKQICKVKLKDTLYYSKLNDPIIRITGLMSEENGKYTITRIIKLELGERIKVTK